MIWAGLDIKPESERETYIPAPGEAEPLQIPAPERETEAEPEKVPANT